MNQETKPPALCACGQTRGVEDPTVVVTVAIAGVAQRYVEPRRPGDFGQYLPPRVRACRGCGVIYVSALAGVPEPERKELER